ncbi:MAG TPA: type II toxin-antitoxin system RelE/ParE family toxin [Sphingomicrobium sp.]|nr:type II toxin-antitoxin system RelE/ParE family toxin [Sphingomicrobium sp.]
MSGYSLGPHAEQQLDEIYEYTAIQWGEDQADRYIELLFQYFSDVSAKNVIWRAVPAQFGVNGYFGKYEHHFVYWRVLSSGEVGFVAILHERMHQIEQIRDLTNRHK